MESIYFYFLFKLLNYFKLKEEGYNLLRVFFLRDMCIMNDLFFCFLLKLPHYHHLWLIKSSFPSNSY